MDVFLFHVAILLDAKLRWKENVKKKREEFGLKYQKKNIYWLMGRRSALSTRALQTGLEASVELWHTAMGMHETEQHCYNTEITYKILRNIVDACWYVRNADLHRDLSMKMVTTEIRGFAKRHEEWLLQHDNVEAIQLLDNSEVLRRLKRTKPFELVS